jgi:enoyl-CoA hydratase/carnithine racemase
MTQEPAVIHEIRGGIATVTLNRPDNRNSMTAELLDRFGEATRAVREAPDVRCVVITGSGGCFSAGADFKSIVQRDDGPGRAKQPHERSYAMYEPFFGVLDFEVPVVAALNGHAIGGGFGLALLCDLRIANADAKYGANFAKLGISSGMGISYLLPRIVGAARAAELLFTGRTVRGADGAAIGLFNEAVPAADVLPRATALARDVADAAPFAVREIKRALRDGLDWDVRGHAWREAWAQAASLATEDAREGVEALLAKRKPVFRGA